MASRGIRRVKRLTAAGLWQVPHMGRRDNSDRWTAQEIPAKRVHSSRKEQALLKFTVTVANNSDKPLDLRLTYVSAHSSNEEADQVFDSGTGLRGPPDTKLSKGRASKFDVGFGVADTEDVVMEIALHDDSGRPSLLYST